MTNSSTTQNTTVGHNVVHSGSGTLSIGGITNNLNITNLLSSDLVMFSVQFLYAINHRDWKTAETYLKSLQSLNSLDEECKCLLQLLEYKLSLYHGNTISINQDCFLKLIRSSNASLTIKDISESIFIHHLSLSSESEALRRYNTSQFKNSFTEGVYFELLALTNELETRVNNNISDLYEHELCSLVRCAIRCEKFQLAVELAEKLLERYPNVNSKILLSLSCAYRIHQEINGRHYWLIEKHLMEELDSKIQDCLVLAKKSRDNRIVHISSVLLSATYFQSSDLLDICNQNIEEAKKVFPQIEIYLKNETDDANKFRSVNQILSANDLSLNEDDFAQVCSALFSGKITNREVKKWLTMGGDVSASDHQLTAFMRITLKSVACNPDDSSTKVTISEELDDFLKTSLKNIHEFNTFFIYKLCKRLNQIGLSLYVVQLIEPLLPNTPWASPIIDVYSQALLWSDKLEKLDKLLNKMEGVKDSYILLAVKIEKSCKSNDFIKAIELTEFALEKYNNSCYYWGVLLRILHLSNSTPSEKISAIKRIPSSILDTYSEEGLRLLNWIANSDLLLAESMILEWFIDDPVGMATHITNLHFNNIDRRQTQKITNYSSSRCSEAIVYKIGKQQYTKLLVENCKPNEHLLDVDTPLGTLLKNADIGEDVTIGITTYTIVEKIAPIVGAFRIAINIRHDINSGTDCFYRLTIEDDSIDSILNQIDSMSKQQ